MPYADDYEELELEGDGEWEGHTPLQETTRNSFAEHVLLLLEAGGDPNLLGYEDIEPGLNALHFAVCEEDLEMVKLLIENGAGIQQVTYPAQRTPLHLAGGSMRL